VVHELESLSGAVAPVSALGPRRTVLALLAASLVAWCVALATISERNVNGLGFAGAFNAAAWIALGCAAIATVVTIRGIAAASRWFWPLVVTCLGLLIAVLHGTPMIIESAPRFFEAYNHVGFIDYIYRTHEHSTKVNIRFAWPGAFGLGATLSGTAGAPMLLGAIRVFPTVFACVILLPIHSIVRAFVNGRRARAAALVLFVIGNWIAQDYFSPQAVAYFISMTLVALVLHIAPAAGPSIRRFSEWAAPRRTDCSVVVIFTLMVVATVVAHQLTPMMEIALILALVVSGATTMRVFPVATFVIFVTWLSVGAYTFWVGNFNVLFGVRQFGGQSISLTTIIAENLTNRLKGDGLTLVVALSRVGLSFLYMAAGFLVFWLGRRDRRIGVLSLLAVAPFVFLGSTGYGGEALLRAFFFSLPFLSILGALLLERIQWKNWSVAAACIILAMLAATTEISRYGNEQFEQVEAVQLTAMEDLYHATPPKIEILVFSSALPVNFVRVGDARTKYMNFFTYVAPGPSGPNGYQETIDQIQAVHPQVVVWSPEAATFAVRSSGFPKGWDTKILDYLITEAHGTYVVDRPDIKIINLDKKWHPSPGAFSNVRN